MCTALHTRVPLGSLPRGVWVNLLLDMATLTASNFGGARFGRLEGICIGASCRLRRICTLKDASFIAPGGSPAVLAPGDVISSDHPAYAATVPSSPLYFPQPPPCLPYSSPTAPLYLRHISLHLSRCPRAWSSPPTSRRTRTCSRKVRAWVRVRVRVNPNPNPNPDPDPDPDPNQVPYP